MEAIRQESTTVPNRNSDRDKVTPSSSNTIDLNIKCEKEKEKQALKCEPVFFLLVMHVHGGVPHVTGRNRTSNSEIPFHSTGVVFFI